MFRSLDQALVLTLWKMGSRYSGLPVSLHKTVNLWLRWSVTYGTRELDLVRKNKGNWISIYWGGAYSIVPFTGNWFLILQGNEIEITGK